MGLRLIRQSSDTPNISNKDDARMVRYAYGGYDGFVKGKGSELGHSIDGAKFTLNSGIINLQGWEVEIDSDGWSMTINSSDVTKRYFVVYCEVNLSLGGVTEIKSTYDTAGFPTISTGDDLTTTTNGTARLPLYQFTAQSGIISNVEKVIKEIPYNSDVIAIINQRLKEEGFREASVENGEVVLKNDWADASIAEGYPEVTFVKSGRLVVFKRLLTATKTDFEYDGDWLKIRSVIGKVSETFAPHDDVTVNDLDVIYNNTTGQHFAPSTSAKRLVLHSNGEIELIASVSQVWYEPKSVMVRAGLSLEINGNYQFHVWIKNFEEET